MYLTYAELEYRQYIILQRQTENDETFFIRIVRNWGREGLCALDPIGIRIAGHVKTYPVCRRRLPKRKRSIMWNSPVYSQMSDKQSIPCVVRRRNRRKGGQVTYLSLVIHLPKYATSRWLRTAVENLPVSHPAWTTYFGTRWLVSPASYLVGSAVGKKGRLRYWVLKQKVWYQHLISENTWPDMNSEIVLHFRRDSDVKIFVRSHMCIVHVVS